MNNPVNQNPNQNQNQNQPQAQAQPQPQPQPQVQRIPSCCANRKNNNFRCAIDVNGTPRTPRTDGADCANCPNFSYTPPRAAHQQQVEEQAAKTGAAVGSVVLGIFAVLIAAGIFLITALIKSCAG